MVHECPLCGVSAVFFIEAGARHFFRCEKCALIFLEPKQRLNSEDERKRYALHQNNSSDPDYRAFLNQIAAPLMKCISPEAKGLDYGSGPGPTLSKMFEEHGFKMEIYDPYFADDKAALEKNYDFITCSETAEHFFNPGKEFGRLRQMLWPGGWLGILTQVFREEQAFETWHYMKDPTHVSFYGEKTFEWIAKNFEFEFISAGPNVKLFRRPAL